MVELDIQQVLVDIPLVLLLLALLLVSRLLILGLLTLVLHTLVDLLSELVPEHTVLEPIMLLEVTIPLEPTILLELLMLNLEPEQVIQQELKESPPPTTLPQSPQPTLLPQSLQPTLPP